jgi:hypothetical protein
MKVRHTAASALAYLVAPLILGLLAMVVVQSVERELIRAVRLRHEAGDTNTSEFTAI